MLDTNPGLDVGWSSYYWLDPIIEEQAAHYGLTVEQHAELMDAAAHYDEDHPEL